MLRKIEGGRRGDNRGWDAAPHVLQSMGSQRVEHDWATELIINKLNFYWYELNHEQMKRTILLIPGKNYFHPNPLNFFCEFKIILENQRTDILMFSVQFSHSVMSDSLWPHGLQHAILPCPSPTPRSCSNSCPLSQWFYPTISSSVISFSSHHLSQHQGLFQWVTSLHQVVRVLEFQLQHQSFQCILRTDFL